MPTKTNTKRPARKNQSRHLSLKSVPKFNKKIALILFVLIAAFGAWRMFFAAAAPNNCQADSGINVCDVDMTAGAADTVLSVGPEALALYQQGWGMYYGVNFRAPTGPLRGAVPVHRLANEKYSWHEWVTDAQKKEKEAKYDGNKVYEGVVFYAWTTQAPGTVPVYRMTRGGGASQSIYSTDKAWVDKMIAENANNPDGWKIGTVLPAIAFYAYPPGYTVANQVNPYDCSIQENFLSDRCKMQREALLAAEKAGTLPKTSACPTTYDAYKKAPFPGQFTADCQKKWNDYARQQQQPVQQSPPSQQVVQQKPPTVSKPVVTKTITQTPTQPPVATQYDECPNNPGNRDAALLVYIDGVNRLKKNYSKDCHAIWWAYSGERNKQEDLKKFYGEIERCQSQDSTVMPGRKKVYYDFGCHDFTKQEAAFLGAVQANNVARASVSQANNPAPASPAGSQAPEWTCWLIGKQNNGNGYKLNHQLFVVRANSRAEAANDYSGPCQSLRSAINREPDFMHYEIYDVKQGKHSKRWQNISDANAERWLANRRNFLGRD